MAVSLPFVVEQHAEEAAFLWILRNQATHAPNYDLHDLAELDERVDAHLDGLRIAGTRGWDAARGQLEWREAGEVFAAAWVGLQSRIGRRVHQVLDVAVESPELARGFVAALGWLPFEDVAATISSLVNSHDAEVRRVGIAASAAHRRDPGRALRTAAMDPLPAVRVRALKAAAQLGRCDLLAMCSDDGCHDVPNGRFWAGWSSALLGDRRGGAVLSSTAVAGGPHSDDACDLATRQMTSSEAAAWCRYLLDGDEDGRLAITAARAHGDPAAVPWLLELMSSEPVARAAGEAFSFITGVDLRAAGLAVQAPEGFESGPTDNIDDDRTEMDGDEHLPWPNQRAVTDWWQQHRDRYAYGARYLAGRPISDESLHDVLARGNQRQRAAAALEIVLLRPGRPLFEVRARADQQLAALVNRRAPL